MSQSEPIFEDEAPQPRRRRGWLWGIFGCLGALAVLCIVVIVGFFIFGKNLQGQMNNTKTDKWTDIVNDTDIEVYAPKYVPSGAGKPQIVALGVGGFKTVQAKYTNSPLVIAESNNGGNDNSQNKRNAQVNGAKEAWFTDNKNGNSLVVHKGSTWIIITGVKDDEMLKIANSLYKVS